MGKADDGTYHIDGRNGEALLPGIGEQPQDVVAVDDARLEVEFGEDTHLDGCGRKLEKL